MPQVVRGLACVVGFAFAITAAPAGAAADEAAGRRDVERLQDAIANLDDSLAALDPRHERHSEFQDRADEIREDVIWLKVEIRRAQRQARGVTPPTRDAVEDIRVAIEELQREIDDDLGRRLSGEASLSEGTEIQVRLETALSSATARREDRVTASVALPVRSGGRVVIPAGVRVEGVVREAERAQRPARGGRLQLSFDSIYFDDRERTPLRTRVVAVDEKLDTGKTAKKAGVGAAIGGVLGSILGGKQGAVIGIVVGGAGGVVASEGQDVELPAGAILTLHVERPLTVRGAAPDR